MSKLFTSLINNRLLKWSESQNVVSDAQFGFKPNYGTKDAIFALHSIIYKTLKCKRKLYCCFVDHKKVFDSVPHIELWQKMIKSGITGKLFNVIHSIYKNVRACVKLNGQTSDFFKLSVGLMQGEALSPYLFSLYVNDLEMSFLESPCEGYQFNLLNIYLLMYADDTVLINDSPAGLQTMLDTLSIYLNKWKLNLNVQKTKIVVFRNGSQPVRDNWYFDGEMIENVNSFCYLGLVLNYNGSFSVCQKTLASQGRKARGALFSKTKKLQLNLVTRLKLFDTYVTPVLLYGSEIWGLCNAQDIEKVHTEFLRQIVGVRRGVSNSMLYYETGRWPLYIKSKSAAFKILG